jgi:hypothetical protein
MTRNLLDDTTRQALIGLDPAPADLDAAAMKRADESLARILTADLDGPPISGFVPSGSLRMRRIALLGAVALVAAVAVVGTQLFGGGSPAYASWTATPRQPTASQEIAASTACRASLLASLEETPQSDPGGVTRTALRRASTVLAEQRGDWTLVVLGDGGGLDASCVTQDDAGASTDNSWEASGYRESLNLGPRDILVSRGGTGGSRNNLMSVLIGFVGTNVRGVTVHTAEHDEVTATVTNGRVAAWWPGPRGVSVSDPHLGTAVDATVTYSDGTTEERRLDIGPNPG